MTEQPNFIFTQPVPETIQLKWRIDVGDALETLKTWHDGQIQLWLTSPPYRSKFNYGTPGECGGEDTLDEYIAYLTAVAREMLRCSKPSANLFFVIQDSANGSGGPGGDFRKPDGSYTPHQCRGARERDYPRKAQLLVPERIRLAFAEVGWHPVLKIIWDKSDSRRGAKDRPSYSYEEILAFSRDADGLYEEIMLFSASPDRYWDRDAVLAPFAGASLPQLNADTPYTGQAKHDHNDGTDDPSELKRRMIKSMQERAGAYLRAVWNIPSGSQPVVMMYGENGIMTDVVRGIASFPLLLAEICIGLGSAIGDLVADPFCGMATTLLAAVKWGRSAKGIELNERFANAARQRMKNEGY